MHELIQQYFSTLFPPPPLPSLEAGNNQVYGEIYYYSLRKVLNYLSLTNADCFLDLGSGVGKTALQVLLTTPVQSVVGLEINLERHSQAQKAIETAKQELPILFQNKTLELYHQDFTQTALDLSMITVLYTCSTAFDYPLLQQISSKLNQLPRLHTLVTTRKLPDLALLKLEKTLSVECSWDSASCFIYRNYAAC